MKDMGSSICAEIHERNEQTNMWPPTPLDVMGAKTFDESNSMYNLLAWIVEPHASCDEKGIVKLSVTKATKVSKILCRYRVLGASWLSCIIAGFDIIEYVP